jgi:hypothetical protein
MKPAALIVTLWADYQPEPNTRPPSSRSDVNDVAMPPEYCAYFTSPFMGTNPPYFKHNNILLLR